MSLQKKLYLLRKSIKEISMVFEIFKKLVQNLRSNIGKKIHKLNLHPAIFYTKLECAYN